VVQVGKILILNCQEGSVDATVRRTVPVTGSLSKEDG